MKIKLFEQFNESASDWLNVPVRGKDGKTGKIVKDSNPGMYRTLTILWDDGTKYDLVLANVGKNPVDKEEVEFEYTKIRPDGKTTIFPSKEEDGKWARISNESETIKTFFQLFEANHLPHRLFQKPTVKEMKKLFDQVNIDAKKNKETVMPYDHKDAVGFYTDQIYALYLEDYVDESDKASVKRYEEMAVELAKALCEYGKKETTKK